MENTSRIFYNKYSELIRNYEDIDEEKINKMKGLYHKYINEYNTKSTHIEYDEIMKDIYFLEKIIIEYNTIENFLNNINRFMKCIKKFNKSKSLTNREDIEVMIESKKILKLIIENKISINRIFNARKIENIPLIIEIYNDFIIKYSSKETINNMLSNLYSSQLQLYNIIDSYDYIDKKLGDRILKLDEINKKLEEMYKSEYAPIINKLEKDIFKYINIFRKKIKEHNIKFVEYEKYKYKDFFRKIENKSLDSQQIEAILKDEYNNLIVAGAGCGKTITILGKILYVLEKRLCKSDEILVISFTNSTTDELKARIDKLTKSNIQVTNFHKLGLSIIKTVQKDNVKVLRERYNTIVNIIYNLSKESTFRELLKTYIIEYYSYEKIDEEFNNFEEYIKYYAQRKDILYTIKGEKVKSFEEKQIANYLYINGIEYEYEKEYKYNTTSERYKNQYKPDFYLPEYDIYIEHFGVDKYGMPPSFYSDKDKYKYKKGMEWKFKIHKTNKTKLITTYSWEYKEQILLEALESKLRRYGIRFNRLTEEKLNNIIKTKLKDFLKTIEIIINIIKIQGKTIEQVREINQTIKSIDIYNYSRNKVLLDIVECVYSKYSEYLKNNNQLDFVDMIKKSTEYIEAGQYTKKYRYIIIDEYQDISIDRVKLIKALREIDNAKLFCVGDDWQSIYGFAGSNVNLFTGFENIFGYTEKSKIENTYRFGYNVINLSEKFIQTNPNQIKKRLKSSLNNKTDIYIYSYSDKNKYALLDYLLVKIPKNATVLLLDRYDEYKMSFKIKKAVDNIICKYKDILKISYRTIHQSKGLEADYVIVLNNTDKIKGFPSKIKNENLIDLILEKEEKYPFEEERRLFYVAMTRCKKGLFFMVDGDIKSQFIIEIENNKFIRFDDTYYERKNICPKCFSGVLVQKDINGRNTNICSNYPICNYIEYI